MSANSLYIAYEDYLIGRVPSLSTYYFYGSDPGGANEKVALQLIKYAIEKLLNWTVDTAVKRFDEYIIKQLKLERIILYIDYPTEVKKGDVEYILSLIYGISYDCFVFVHLTFLLVLKNIYSFNMKGYENKNSQEVNCHFCFSYKNEFFLSEYIVKKENFYI